MRLVFGLAFVLACAPPSVPQNRAIELLAYLDLARAASTRGLSGITWDASNRTLYAIQDHTPAIVPLEVGGAFRSLAVRTPIPLSGLEEGEYDGEGIALVGDSFVAVTNETAPRVERFDRTGHRIGGIELPAIYKDQHGTNKGIESLSATPRFLFFATEAALLADGPMPTKEQGTTVRILRRAIDGTSPDREWKYRTEPLGQGTGGDMGVSDIAAIADDDLLVLERGHQSDFGNTVRLFRVHLGAESLVRKALVLDFVTLPPSGATHVGREPNPLLDNYEGLALGPTLADGRRVVFAISDDNGSDDQIARLLVLAIPL